MKTIYKYHLEVDDIESTLEIQASFRILDIQVQDNKVCMWAEVDTEAPIIIWSYYVFVTGHQIPTTTYNYVHLKTVQLNQFVWHIFKRENL